MQLSEVFVIAQSRASYALAHSRQTDFQDWLVREQRILRINDIISFSVDGDEFVDSELHTRSQRYEFRVSLTEPVAQGYARKEGTRIILLHGSNTHEDEAHVTNGVNGPRIVGTRLPFHANLERYYPSFVQHCLASPPSLMPVFLPEAYATEKTQSPDGCFAGGGGFFCRLAPSSMEITPSGWTGLVLPRSTYLTVARFAR